MSSLKGWKTRLFFGCTFAVGLLTEFQAIDLHGLMVAAGISEHQSAVVMLGMSVAGIVLRQITTTPPAAVIDKDKS